MLEVFTILISYLSNLKFFKELEYLTLTGSPIAAQKNYRLYVINNVSYN